MRAGHYRLMRIAFEGGGQLGFKTGEEIAESVLTLTNADFYKNMTSNQNHKERQDVYHGQALEDRRVYLKFIVINDVLILSFKEK